MTQDQKILVVGATGYLGMFIVKALKRKGYYVRALSRDGQKIVPLKPYIDDLRLGEATKPESIKGLCKDIDIIFSTLGITKQKDGLTYMDVDYQANRNILTEGLTENIKKFVYISVFNSDKLLHLEIVKAKERFAQELKEANIEHVIIRPNGFFSDMTEFFKMAKKGRVYLIGKGEFRSNPIHGEDLAMACVECLDASTGEVNIGGPEILTQNEISFQAFEALEKKPKITYIPLRTKNWILKLVRLFTSVKIYGPVEFFMTVLTMDMVAPTYGRHTLRDYFKELSEVERV